MRGCLEGLVKLSQHLYLITSSFRASWLLDSYSGISRKRSIFNQYTDLFVEHSALRYVLVFIACRFPFRLRGRRSRAREAWSHDSPALVVFGTTTNSESRLAITIAIFEQSREVKTRS